MNRIPHSVECGDKVGDELGRDEIYDMSGFETWTFGKIEDDLIREGRV